MTIAGPFFTQHQSRGVGARMIRARQRGWSNHTGILRDLDPSTLIVESRSRHADGRNGVWMTRTVAQAIAGGDQVRIFQLPPALTPEHEVLAWAWLMQQIGKKYDGRGLRGFVPIPLPLGLGANRRQDLRKMMAEWWCSEVAKAFGDQRGVPVIGTSTVVLEAGQPGVYVEPWRVDPDMLMLSPVTREVTDLVLSQLLAAA